MKKVFITLSPHLKKNRDSVGMRLFIMCKYIYGKPLRKESNYTVRTEGIEVRFINLKIFLENINKEGVSELDGLNRALFLKGFLKKSPFLMIVPFFLGMSFLTLLESFPPPIVIKYKESKK
jgi:hypothetical protein